ncbi:MAG TPA: hypothetical protein VD883_02105, partial [Candidatus Omnitrophota bacterium]|nr:hypothetical protein [Candidatus Omnitrophota bacterium]
PVHLNETATFPYLIGLIRHYMEEGYSYEDSLKLVGSQLVFFTHTLVAAGIDHFHEDGVKMGHYIRSYFEKSSSEEVRKQAGNVARDMIHGRRSEDGKLYLPGFEESHRRNVYSPLHFVVRLAHSFNGTVVAVSQLNAIEAGKFFIQQGIITPEENAKKPVLGITNGVDHLFWMIREVRDVMNWQESEPEKRTPERILDPDDPEAKRLAALFDRTKEFGSIGEEPVLKDETLFEKLYENKKLAVEMVRNTVRDQYIRETGIIEEATRQNHVTHEELERLHVLRVRWAHWIGKENPQEWVKSWEGRPFEEQEPFRKELHAGELKGLMDPDLFLGVWARRIVNYKRILFTIFGHFLPEVEAQMPTDHALSPKELDDIILRLKNKGALNQFIELVVKKKAQFIFAGKAFSEDGRSSVALIHRLIELLSKEHPEFQDRVLFLEGYDETKSQYLVRGADTWINTPKRPLEASGTSGMKVAKGDIYSSPNGDGWGAGGIEDKLNGRVRGIIGTHQDHPDTWPASERENASNVSYYLGQEAAHFNEMMSEEIDRYNKAMAYFLKKDESQHFNAVEWLQQIRRWMYFTALVYDIRGEFTGRRVPSFRPEDVPGGDERGIFSLYEEAIAKTQALKRSIAEEKKAQGARLAGLYENRILGEINREKILYNGQENTKKLADSIRELIPDHENVTRLVYPASNFDDVTVASLIRVFPNIEEVFVVDFFGIPNYDLNDPRSRFTVERKKEEMQKMWSDNLNRVLKVFEIERKDLKLHVLVNDYYRAPEIAVKKARGLTVLIEKFPGYQAKMRGEAEFRQSILRDTRPGDLVFSVRGGHFEVLKWSQPPLAKNLSLPYLWDWQEKWDVTRLSQEDRRLSGARLAALPVPKRRENFESILEDLLAPKQNELAPLVTQYRNANGPLKKELDTKINAIIDEINLIRLSPGHKVEDIDIAPPSYYVDDFVRSGDYPRYRESAERMLLNGHYVPQFIFAGAATRLLEDLEKLFGKKLDPKSFRMYGLDLWSVLREAQKYDASLRTIQIPAETPALGMGPRQILAYRLLLEKLAAKYQMDVQKVLLAQRPVFNINEEIAEEVIEDFVGNKFYGMDPQKVIFIITPVFKGFNYADGKVTEDPQSPKLPYGHGYSTTQLAYAEAFTLTKDGEPRSLPVSALDILIENDPENDHVLGTHRINDATKFVTDEVVSLDRLALSLYLIREKKHGITIDLVGNPTHQKGGNNVRLKGESRSFLIETSNAKGSAYLIDPDPKRAQGLLDQAARQEAPYNAFRLTSTPRIYKDLIKRGIRYNVRWRSGNFYLESVTGDLTQLETSNSVAIQKKGDLIHDFKQISNYKDTVEFLKRQDREILDAEKTQGARLADRRGQKGSVARLAAERLDAAKNFYDYAVSVTISRNTFKDSALSTMLHKYSGTGALRRSQDLFDIYYPVFWKDTFNELSLELQKPQPNYFAIYTFLSITIAKTKPFLIFAEENSYSYLGLPSEEARRTFISSWKSGEAKLLEVLDVLKQAIPPDDRMPLSASSGNVQDDLREASGMLRRLARFYIDKAWEADPKERRSMYEAAGQIETPSFSSFAGKPREQFMLEVLNTAERIEEIETILLEYPSETIRSESLTTLHYLLDKRLGPMTQKVRLVGTGEEFNGFSILYHALLWTHAQGASQKLSDAIEKLTQGEGTSAGARLADPTRLQNVLAGISYFESEIGYLLDRTV